MKFHILSFSLTSMIIGTLPLAILFTWCAINGFGAELVRLFETIHPTGGFSIIENMDNGFLSLSPGVIINSFYAAIDFFILGFGFSSLYNLFIARLNNK